MPVGVLAAGVLRPWSVIIWENWFYRGAFFVVIYCNYLVTQIINMTGITVSISCHITWLRFLGWTSLDRNQLWNPLAGISWLRFGFDGTPWNRLGEASSSRVCLPPVKRARARNLQRDLGGRIWAKRLQPSYLISASCISAKGSSSHWKLKPIMLSWNLE